MKVKALKPWSNGEISMEQYEVRDLPDALAQNLIDAGIVVEIGGGSGGGVLVVTDTDGTLDKTWQEIHDAFVSGSVRIQNGTDTNTLLNVLAVEYSSKAGEYMVKSAPSDNWSPETYVVSSASGYPTNT